MEKSALATLTKQKNNQVSPPMDHIVSNMEIADVNVIPLTIVPPRRTQRFVQLTDKLRSPHFNRAVDPNAVLKQIEERFSGWIFTGLDDEWDMVFESKFGDSGYHGIFESMIPGLEIHGTIIDIWANILNHQEQRRNRKSPSRMFISCTLLSNFVLDETISIKKRYKTFLKRMNEYVEKYKQYINFKVVDLVFFPVLQSHHYYLIVFDFIKSVCIIIDNIYSEESIYVKYGNVPYDLIKLFNMYIESLNHPKTPSMKCTRPVRFSMEWMTKRNYIDCGIFLMRHMETYKGEEADK